MKLIVLVGQSRSGSTLLTRLMNDSRRSAIINDAYIVQLADALAEGGELDAGRAEQLVTGWLDIIRSRSEHQTPASIHKSLVLTPEEHAALVARVAEVRNRWRDWPGVVEGVLEILADIFRAQACGWNTPPDYAHAERLLRQFPGSRIVFLIRDPLAVLLSYKQLPAYWGDEKNRYNPIVQSLVWRKVVGCHARAAAAFPGRTMLIRYEDLVAEPKATMARLSEVCGVEFAVPELSQIGTNSSFANRQSEGLSHIERWIGLSLTGGLRRNLGYGDSALPVAGHWGLGGFLVSSWRSARYYGRQFIQSRDIRLRVLRFARLLILDR